MTSSRKNSHDELATLFAQAGGVIDSQTGAVVPAIQSATTFARDENNEPISADHIYSRDQNDLVRLGEKLLAQAEHADGGLLLPSGMAAVAAIIRTVPSGGRIILQSGIYWGSTKFVRDFCHRRSVDLIEVDCSDISALSEATKGLEADIVWIETPSNPYLKTVDIAACSEVAKILGAILVVDSTAATPVHSQPIDHGADIVMHSATKAINGHSDVLAGFLACKDASSKLWQDVKVDRHSAGAVIGSFEAWLLVRGMRTLPLRAERMSENALKIANYLENHTKVESVMYPGLPSHAGYEISCRQMSGGFGCLLSFCVDGTREETLQVAGRLNLFKRATSLGGVESLVEHRHTIEDTVPDNLLRLSVGIEAAEDLISDLEQALR